MKAIPQGSGGLMIEAENDAEKIWLSELLKNIPKKYQPLFSTFMEIDLEEGALGKDNQRAIFQKIQDVIPDDPADWDTINAGAVRIRFDLSLSPFEEGGVEEEINKLNT